MPVSRSEMAPRLAEARGNQVPAPHNRGRLYYDYQIPDVFFEGLPHIANKIRWIREHLPRDTRIKIGRDSAWYEADICSYLERRRCELSL